MDNNTIIVHECKTCGREYSSKSGLNTHYQSQTHAKNLERLKQLKNNKGEDFVIFLKNKKGETVAETIVDKKVYKHIYDRKYPIHFTKDGYAQVIVKGVATRLHRYIYYNFYKNEKHEFETVIDHKNGSRLDNRIENLREVTHSINASNRRKNLKSTSEYYGVSYNTKSQKWCCMLENEGKVISLLYEEELHAAYHYDLFVKKFGLEESKKINNIKKPRNFKEKQPFEKKENLPRGVCVVGNKYIYSFKNKHSISYSTPDEAIGALNDKIKEYELGRSNEIKSKPIQRTIDDVAVLELFNKNKEKVGEVMVDEDNYYDLMQYSWRISLNYVSGSIKGKNVRLSRYIMNCDDKSKVVDHIDGNHLNNQKHNLRILTIAENNQNKSSKQGSSSKYTGIYYNKRSCKWVAGYRLNGKLTVIGKYDDELEAAKAREKKIIKVNAKEGTYFKLNFPNAN
jgi:hypothetical protein